MIARQQVMLVGALAGLALLLPAGEAEAQAPRPKITQVFVDVETDTIEIEGENFDRLSPLTVTLGDPAILGDITADCGVDTGFAPQIITCTLAGGLPEPGDYLLTVSGGPSPWTVSYDLTIGEEATFTASCPAGSAIREIKADGSIACEFDTGENIGFTLANLVVGAGATVSGTATCASGTLISGGYLCPEVNGNTLVVFENHAINATSWQIGVRNFTAGTFACTVYAMCSAPPLGFPSP